MNIEPAWIRPSSDPIFCWYHTPSHGMARGAVLLCPPLGREHIASHSTFRRLAEQLVGEDLAVLRFDYRGTGDSADPRSDHGTVDSWRESVHVAADWLSDRTETDLVLIGMRMGAVFAQLESLDRNDVRALVLWDPCRSGREFLREQRALRLLSLPGRPDKDESGVETPGFLYGAETVEALKRLDPASSPGDLPQRRLLLCRSETARTSFLNGTDIDFELHDAFDQSTLLDVSTVLAVEPTATLDFVRDWVRDSLDETLTPVRLAGLSSPVTVGWTEPGLEVIEAPVSIGPAKLFAMRTICPGRVDRRLPAVLFLNTAQEVHIGPGRLWVELARALAPLGFEVLRADGNGIGDSPERRKKNPLSVEAADGTVVDLNRTYAPDLLDDIEDLVAEIDRQVILVGVCSGAYHAIEMGAALGVAGVCAVNPVLDFIPPEVQAGLPMDPRRKAVQPRRTWANAAKDKRLGRTLRKATPDFVWQLISFLRLQPAPINGLRLLAEGNINSLVICSAHDANPYLERGANILRHLTASERFTFTVMPELDHALLERSQREQVSRLIQDHLLSNFAYASSGRRWTGSDPVPPERTDEHQTIGLQGS
jgi:alpha-beta hydrolase superfamily lysophospholipase